MKRCQKNWAGLPPLIWTKSKRTAGNHSLTVKKCNQFAPILATCALEPYNSYYTFTTVTGNKKCEQIAPRFATCVLEKNKFILPISQARTWKCSCQSSPSSLSSLHNTINLIIVNVFINDNVQRHHHQHRRRRHHHVCPQSILESFSTKEISRLVENMKTCGGSSIINC